MNEDKKTKVVGMLSDEKYIKMHEQSRRVYGTDGIAPTIHTCGGGNLEPKIMCDVIQNPRGYNPGGEIRNDIFPTLREDNTARYTNAIANESDHRVRKLTPKECWRLMGFSDEDFEKAKTSGVSNSQLYTQAGNSIVVSVLEAIFKKLF